MHLYKGLLELNPFNQAPRGCIKMLSLQVRTVYIGPGEVLLAQNDVINAIYYIASGSMEVLQGESVAAILGKCTVKFIYLTTSLSRNTSDTREKVEVFDKLQGVLKCDIKHSAWYIFSIETKTME